MTAQTHGISNPYPWYIEPPVYGILFDPSNPWYFVPTTHGISNCLPMVFCMIL
jgi:hypothetical protein